MQAQITKRLRARFDSLPFETIRVRRHIDAGHVRLGDFLQLLDSVVQADKVARPTGRSSLSRGDAECYVASDGARCAWEVTAVVEGTALVAVTVTRPGRPTHHSSISWCAAEGLAARGALASEKDSAVRELFGGLASEDELVAAAWNKNRHCLDLWDWNTAQPLATPDSEQPGAGVAVRGSADLDGPWIVETPEGAFSWLPLPVEPIVGQVSGAAPSDKRIQALFARPPVTRKA